MTAGSPRATDAVVCLITAPQGNARSIATTVIDRRLAACVNVVASVRSIYRWKGEVEQEDEALLIVKTTRAAIPRLDALLGEIHPYENYELVALDVVAGSHPYLRWIADSVGPPPKG